MAENGFTNLGDNFDKEKNEGVETTVAPAPQGRWELECVYSVEQTTEGGRSEEHTSELKSLKRITYAVSLIGRAHV